MRHISSTDMVRRISAKMRCSLSFSKTLQIHSWTLSAQVELFCYKMNPDQEYSLMARYCFFHFEELIIPLLQTEAQQEVVRTAYLDYISY